MNREDLITHVSDKTGFLWADVARIWDGMMEDVLLLKADRGRVVWPGFGSFEWYDKKARSRRIPFPPFVVNSPVKPALRFVPSKRVKDVMRGRRAQ